MIKTIIKNKCLLDDYMYNNTKEMQMCIVNKCISCARDITKPYSRLKNISQLQEHEINAKATDILKSILRLVD